MTNEGKLLVSACRAWDPTARDYRRVPSLSLKSSSGRFADPSQCNLEAGILSLQCAETLTFGGDHIRFRVGNELFVRKLAANTSGLLLGFCNRLLRRAFSADTSIRLPSGRQIVASLRTMLSPWVLCQPTRCRRRAPAASSPSPGEPAFRVSNRWRRPRQAALSPPAARSSPSARNGCRRRGRPAS